MNIFTEQQIKEILKLIESTITNCERIQPKLKEGSPSLSLNKNRIKALYISKDLLMNKENQYTKDELEKAIIQINSIKNKSTTGINNAKEGSSTYTRFSRIIKAMDVTLEYLQQALEK
ncbi:hypothetical protein [Terrisporobacter sp.]